MKFISTEGRAFHLSLARVSALPVQQQRAWSVTGWRKYTRAGEVL
jgi:hypothetical protein